MAQRPHSTETGSRNKSSIDNPKVKQELESLFNKEQLQWLIYLMQEYTERLENARGLCLRVVRYGRTCYLVDFDVIRNFIEMRSLDNVETLTVDFLFLDSEVHFAIPVGAFEELIAYLTPLARASSELSALEKDCEPGAVVRLIAQALGSVDPSQSDNVDRLIEIVSKELDDNIIHLNRLLGILTNPRFEGVKAKYDKTCYIGWLKAIKACGREHRKSTRPRSDVDRRDAMNLSVASRSMRSSESTRRMAVAEESVCYVLLSQTHAVYNLARLAEARAELGGISSYFGVPPSVLKTIHPAAHPRDAMIIEMMGGVDNPEETLSKLKNSIGTFRETFDCLVDEYVCAKDLYKQAFGARIEQQRDLILGNLNRMNQGMLSGQREMGLIEDRRVTLDSEELARNRQDGKSEVGEDRLKASALEFRRLLGRVQKSLGNTSGVDYAARVEEPVPSFAGTQIRIEMVAGEASQSHALIHAEIYRPSGSARSEGKGNYFSMRWPVACLEERLIKGLNDAQNMRFGSLDHAGGVSLVPCGPGSRCWQEGLVVVTSHGDFGMPLSDAFDRGTWDYLKLTRLGPLVKAIGVCPDAGGSGRIPVITQLRLSTPIADIVYDVQVQTGYRCRYVTILSHYRIGQEIAVLYDATHTTSLFCIPAKLAVTLSTVLAEFPEVNPF